MKKFYLGWFLFSLFSKFIFAADVFIVMGPSCSGKSTIASFLASNLGDKWQKVDLDDVVEDLQNNGIQCLNSELDFLSVAVNKVLDSGKFVVIDTNVYNEDFTKTLHAKSIKKVLVYCSLAELINRDLKRTKNLNRSEKRAAHAKTFVLESFDRFFTIEQAMGRPVGVLEKQEIDFILKNLSGDFLDVVFCKTLTSVLQSKKDFINVYACFESDICVDSGINSVQRIVADVVKMCDKSS